MRYPASEKVEIIELVEQSHLPAKRMLDNVRYRESIDNLTPAAVYFGRAGIILAERNRIKRATIANRRLQHQL